MIALACSVNMIRSTLARASDSVLVVIDIQDRLAAAMDPSARAGMVRNTRLLLQTATLFGIPVLLTEQYPRGLGPTSPEVLEVLPASASRLAKTCFSCAGSPEFIDALEATGRTQVILAGMEAHVCVLQSAMALLAVRPEVFVVEDACCSRHAANHANAMQRMRTAGVVVSNTESVMFEWLRDSRHEHFKAVSALIR
jgi:nicotinamidase-related amidase